MFDDLAKLEARRATKRAWRLRNRELINKYHREWQKRNRDKCREYQARYWRKRVQEGR